MRALLIGLGLVLTACEQSNLPQVPIASADLVFRNGAVYTVDPDRPWAEAIAIRDGTIVFVGDSAGAQSYVGPNTRQFELAGRMVLPAFTDAHTHLIGGGLLLAQCNLMDLASVDALRSAIKECHAALPKDQWLVGGGWSLALFENASPQHDLLDQWTPNRPVFLMGEDGHTAWVSSAALTLAGIDENTSPPPGGVIDRSDDGKPSGTLREDAIELVATLLPEPTEAQQRAGLRRAVQLANSLGITAAVEASVSQSELAAFCAADADGGLTLEVVTSLTVSGYQVRDQPEDLLSLRHNYESEHVRTDAVKIFVDGVLEGETAALLEPYVGGVGHAGSLAIPASDLADLVTRLDAQSLQVHLHAIGDRAVQVALDAIASAREVNGDLDNRHHIAHLQLVNANDHERFAKLGVGANFQALWAYPDAYITDINLPVVGQERVNRMYPIGSLRGAGARLVGGSDWPVSSMNPLAAIETAITRQDALGATPGALNKDEAVGLADMIAAYTVNGAWLTHRDRAGQLRVGYRADMVVLEKDLFAIEPQDIAEVRVDYTVFDGKIIYARSE